MNTLIKSSILAAALLATVGAIVGQAMPRDKVLDELARQGAIVTTHGVWGR